MINLPLTALALVTCAANLVVADTNLEAAW